MSWQDRGEGEHSGGVSSGWGVWDVCLKEIFLSWVEVYRIRALTLWNGHARIRAL